MTDEGPDRWTAFHFSQGNPKGRGQDDIPAMLRRVADSIAALGDVEVHDIVFHTELDDDARWWPSLTVYYTERNASE